MRSFIYTNNVKVINIAFICLFVVFRPSREFFTHLAIEQWGFFSVPHLLYPL